MLTCCGVTKRGGIVSGILEMGAPSLAAPRGTAIPNQQRPHICPVQGAENFSPQHRQKGDWVKQTLRAHSGWFSRA